MTTKVSTTMINQTGNVSFTGANVSLGAISNLHITGGGNNQFLSTDGNGNLSFSSVSNTLSNLSNVTLSNVNITGNIIPNTSNVYSIGNNTHRFKDIYLQGNTIYLGDRTLSAEDVLPFDLTIQPEVLTINVDAPFAGNDITWLWTWTQSSLPYARTTITNQQQIQVPLYKQGTYQVNNFANEQHGNMDQRHMLWLKWVDGAGLDNLVSWATNVGNVTFSHPSINGGANTTVQRLNISVPATVTIPTLNLPSNVAYNVAANGSGAYSISGSGVGENRNIGPLYRGATYTFNLDTSLANHPFYITTDNGTGFISGQYVGEYTTGVTGSRGNGQPGYNTLTFTVPQNAPDVLYYQCGNHAPMRGAITIKNLQVETNINGNPILYFQHGKEGHKTPVEIRPIPALVNQMCLVYDATTGQFVPQDMATYVENTPSFYNKIQEVAGTATLIAPDGAVVVPTVLVVEDISYLPLVDNNNGDLAFDAYTDTIYVWESGAWKTTKPNLSSYATQTFVNNSIANLVNSAPATLDTLNELATALGNDASFSTSITNSLANKLNTNAFSNTANSWAANYLPTYTGNVSASFFIGNGSQLTGLPAGYANSDVAAYLPTYTGNITANTANLSGNLNVTGKSNLGNVGNIIITGGTTGQFLSTDGAGNLSWATSTGGGGGSYGNTDVANYLPTFTGNILAGNLEVDGLSTFQQITEQIQTLTGATGVVTHNFSLGSLFYHTSIAANFTVNLTNVPTTNNRSIVVSLVLDQGATARVPSALQIDGVAQTINWAGGSVPAGTANKKDLISFVILRVSNGWIVFGSNCCYG